MLTLPSAAFRRFAVVLPAILVLSILAGCSPHLVPPCPPVRVDNATATITKFKDGPGRDVTDIEYQAEILGYKGHCDYGKESVAVIFDVDMALTRGPAATANTAPLYYFVAVPQFFPDAAGKQIMKTVRKLPGKSGARETFTESGVRVRIPLKADQAGASFDVYVGFQPDSAQLEYNRTRTQR